MISAIFLILLIMTQLCSNNFAILLNTSTYWFNYRTEGDML